MSWPTLVLGGGVVLSLAANLAQADHPSLWGRIVAATPAGAFLVAVSMLERRSSSSGNEPADSSPATPGRPEDAEPRDVPPTPDSPALAGPSEERQLPGDLVAFARRVADEHHVRRGAPITTDALRARMGVSASLAAELHRQITTERSAA